MTLPPGSCLPVSQSACLPVYAVRCQIPVSGCCDAGCGVVSPACLPVWMLDAVTLAAGLCLPLVSLCLPSPVFCDAGSGVVSPCLPVSPSLLVSQSMRSDARCCDAGSGVVSPACLPVWMPDAVTLAAGLCLPLVSLCLPSPVFCDAGSGVVSCLPVPVSQPLPVCLSPSLCGQTPDAATLAAGLCLRLVFLCLQASAVGCQMLIRSPLSPCVWMSLGQAQVCLLVEHRWS